LYYHQQTKGAADKPKTSYWRCIYFLKGFSLISVFFVVLAIIVSFSKGADGT
jgi:hypothetical protein